MRVRAAGPVSIDMGDVLNVWPDAPHPAIELEDVKAPLPHPNPPELLADLDYAEPVELLPDCADKVTVSRVALVGAPKVTPRALPAVVFNMEGKTWCSQCEGMVKRDWIAGCSNRFCKVKHAV